MLLLLVAAPATLLLRIQHQETALRRGVTAEATVVGTVQGGDTTYLRVFIGGPCGCAAVVATTDAARHPINSTIRVRYDPAHPDRAEALVDRPNPYETVFALLAGLVLSAAIIVPLLLAAMRRRRRCRALLTTTDPSMTVRVEAWRRQRSNVTLYYLSVYPDGAPPGMPPILCIPTDAKTVARLRAHEPLALHGEPQPGRPVALKGAEVEIIPSGKTRPGSWEAKHRDGVTDVIIPVADVPKALPDFAAVPLFANASEAKAWSRNSALIRWLLPVIVVLPVLRVLPADVLVRTLPLIAAVLITEYGLLLRRWRLLERIASRLFADEARGGRRSRRAARAAAIERISSPAGIDELAALTGTTPETIAGQQRRSTQVLWGTFGVAGAVLLLALFAPGVLSRLVDQSGRSKLPSIPGAPGYVTVTGPRGRALAVGRPWGAACQPIRFTVEEHVPDYVYDQVVAVVEDARRSGINVTVETRSFLWAPASLYYPGGMGPDDVQRVGIFSDDVLTPRGANGQPERVRLGWDAKADADGKHDDLTVTDGHLRLAAIAGDPVVLRRAIRFIIALTQGVGGTTNPMSSLYARSTADAFTPADVDAMRLMSGCGTAGHPITLPEP